MTDRVSVLQAQGYSLSHASIIATVEWAHGSGAITRFNNGQVQYECAACRVFICAMEWQPQGSYVERVVSHHNDCPIPALGYAVLHEQHWYERRWCLDRSLPAKFQAVTGDKRCHMALGPDEFFQCCASPRGHDNGAHEPEGEL